MTRPGPDVAPQGRVRVLFVIDSLGSGGAERTLKRVIEFVDQARFACRVAVLQVRQGNPAADEIRDLGIAVDLVRVDRLRSPSGHARFLRYLLRHRPQIIHTHLEFAHTLGGIYGRMIGAKPIGTIHTFAVGIASRETRRLGLMWFSLRRAHVLVIAPSRSGMAHARAVGRIPAEKMMLLHNGIDLETFRPSRPGRRRARDEFDLPPDTPLMVTVAVLRKGKGIDDLISAIPGISRSIPELTAWIIGDGSEREALQHLAEESGLADRVLFTGNRDDVASLLSAADLFVLPTHQDLLPTVVAEAMGAGLPVVASDVGGLSDMVENGVTGVLYKAGDVAALTHACVEIVSDSRRGEAMGRAGRRAAEEKFDIRRHVDALQQVYLEILG